LYKDYINQINQTKINQHMSNLSRITRIVLCVFLFTNIQSPYTCFANNVQEKINYVNQVDYKAKALNNYKEDGLKDLLEFNNIALKQNVDSVPVFKKLAIINAELKNPEQAFQYANKYINNTLDFSILHNDSFDNIQDSNEFKLLIKRYLIKFDFFSFIYLYIALIGFFLVIILNFKKRVDKTANILISCFVLVHVLFVIEYVLYLTNVQYTYPHTYLFSSSLALLYGPLLFFYFKRVSQGYVLKKSDVLHFLPTVILIVFVLWPIYSLNATEKIKMMLGTSYSHRYFWLFVFIPKLLSLIIYGFFIGKLYFAKIKNTKKDNIEKVTINWEKNVFRIHLVYVFSYLIYGLSISLLGESASIIYNSHVAAMSVMILYVAYMAYVQPKIFSEGFIILNKINKYEKSGLTESLSKELSENLFKLFIDEKIYKDNGISLESLSDKLGTTRHNASQIINESFNMNFFELINKFRIEEAINILESDLYGNLHIIDVAYEVGFNNKVTFNKAFKKQTSQTPSEFIASLCSVSKSVNC
jgi:AraC-like DNA-binding protein